MLLAACTGIRSVAYHLPAPEKTAATPAGKRQVQSPTSGRSGDWENYLPDPAHPEYLPMRYLRVNFHIMDSHDSSHNFRAAAARTYFREMIRIANVQLDTNVRNWRSPEGTAILPKRYRYVIAPQPVAGDDGFYFHYDDNNYKLVYIGKDQNNYDEREINQYGIGTDSILNIFIQVHPDDSLRSRTYKSSDQGIALGTSLKMANMYESKAPPDRFVGLLTHEIGHILSLPHAWSEDGCPDTDNHANRCWVWSEKEGFCHDNASNNIMDYNAYKTAYTPCQIGRIQAVMATERNPVRNCLLPTFCNRNPEMDVIVRDSIHWAGARDLEGNLTIAPGGALRLSCRLSMPKNSRITVQPGGRLWLDGATLHNACDQEWDGIFVESERSGKKTGTVYTLNGTNVRNTTNN